MFSRVRILPGGQLGEDVDMCDRYQATFTIFSVTDSRENDYGEGCSNLWET